MASEEAPWPICAAFEKTQSEMKAPSTVFRLMRSTDGTCAPVSPHPNPNCVHASLSIFTELSPCATQLDKNFLMPLTAFVFGAPLEARHSRHNLE